MCGIPLIGETWARLWPRLFPIRCRRTSSGECWGGGLGNEDPWVSPSNLLCYDGGLGRWGGYTPGNLKWWTRSAGRPQWHSSKLWLNSDNRGPSASRSLVSSMGRSPALSTSMRTHSESVGPSETPIRSVGSGRRVKHGSGVSGLG